MDEQYEKIAIQWFPGHMTKAQRMIDENMRLVDAVCELLDARIPDASRNPDIDRLAGDKPRLIVLNRADLADPAMTQAWREHFRRQGLTALETDAKTGKGVKGFPAAVRGILREKLAALEAKGQGSRPLRIMILGIPNVGKSTFINALAGRRAAVAGDKPGVKAVDRHRQRPGNAGHAWHPLAEIRFAVRGRGAGADQRHQGRGDRPGGAGGKLHAAPAGPLSGAHRAAL